MNHPIPYNDYAQTKYQGLTGGQKVGVAATVVIGVSALIYFGRKYRIKQKANKSDALSFQDGSAQTIAKQIKMAFENDGDPGTDTKKLRFILTKIKSKVQMGAVWQEYHNQFGTQLYSDMHSELQSTEYDEMVAIMAGKPDKEGQKVPGEIIYKAWAKRLKAGMDKMYGFIPGTDEDCIKTTLNEIPTQRAFINVGVAYYKEYKRNLMPDLKEEFNSFTYPNYLMLITNKPKS